MMHEGTGEPKNSHTYDADQDNRRTRMKECGEALEMQDETIEKILAMLDQQIFQETSEEDDNASEVDQSPEFSQAFKKRMHVMVARRLGPEAADRFIANTASMYEQDTSTDTEEHLSEFRRMSGKAHRPLFKWIARAASVLLVILVGFMVYKTNTVQATGLPNVSVKPEVTSEYSKVGSLKDIISNLDTTNYPQQLDQISIPGRVIAGYEETDREKASVFINIFYENAEKQWYQYQQTTVGATSFIDIENRNCEEIEVGEFPGVYMCDENTGNLWWFDYNYAYHLQGNLSKEEMMEVAESLVSEE